MTKEVRRWADIAMWEAAPDEMAQRGEPVQPRATVVSMTPRPVQTMAAASELYRGKAVKDPEQVLPSDAAMWFNEMSKTKLHAPLEFIDIHFLLEGVTRAFTHQLVRQRTAVYVQESMRFAVKTNAGVEVAYPPSISGSNADYPLRKRWEDLVADIASGYNELVNAGMPAEDARGILPTNITTRVHYKTNLRNLAEHAGLRLCSQAQFEWKQVWSSMLTAIMLYGPGEDRWQQEIIVSLFRPICYQTGRCEFRGENDRYCSIRERVENHYAKGEGPEEWTDINPMEPLLYGAAIARPGRNSE